MNITELKLRLKSEGVKQDMYCLTGGLPNEAYCLNKLNENWEIYYSEKGIKSGLKEFAKEEDACNYLYSLIKIDAINN